MDPKQSVTDDRRAKFGCTSGALYSSAAGEQSHAGQRPNLPKSQELGVAEAMKNMSNDEATEIFKSNVKNFNARYINLEQKLQESEQKKKELKQRHEEQQKTLLEAQMNLESRSSQYEAMLRGREDIVVKIQQTSQIANGFQDHCISVKDALHNMGLAKDTLSEQYSECIQAMTTMETQFRDYQRETEETRNLQQAIQEIKKKREKLDEVWRVKRESLEQEHSKKMAKLKAKFSEGRERKERMQQKLAAAQSRTAHLKEQETIMTQKHTEDIYEVSSKLNSLKTSKEVLEKALHSARQEKAQLTTKKSEKEAEFNAVSESLLNSEARLDELDKNREILREKLTESHARKSGVSKKIQDIDGQIAQKSIIKEELRNKLEHLKQTSSKQILEQKKVLEDTLSMSVERKSKIEQEINDLSLQSDAKLEKCKELQQEASYIKDKRNNLMEANKNDSHLNECLKTQILTTETEKQALTEELQQISGYLEAERIRRSQLESSSKQKAEESEDKMKAFSNDLEKIKIAVLRTQDSLQSKKVNVASLEQNLQQARENAQKSEEEIRIANDRSIQELEEKIAFLENEKLQMTVEIKKIMSELEDKENCQIQLVGKKEEEILQIEKTHHLFEKELESKRKTLVTLKNDIEAKGMVIVELTTKSQISEEELHGRDATLAELSKMLQEEKLKLQSQHDKVSVLSEEIMRIEKEKADAILENAKQTEILLHEINMTKQTCEALSSEQSTLNINLNELQICYSKFLKTIETSEKSITIFKEEIEKNSMQIENNEKISEKLMKDFEVSQSKIKQLKQEGALASQIYQKLRSGIAAAKAKKNNREAASRVDSLGAAEKSKQSSGKSIPSSLVKEKSTEFQLASVGTPEMKQSTRSDINQITPRSILKISKAPTPKEERKSVTFAGVESSDDNASSSSSIMLGPAEFEEIAKNPAAKSQITARMEAKKMKMKGQQSSQGQ